MPADVPLVAAKLITLELTEEHASTGRAPGRHAALEMPLYPSTVARLLQLTPAVILAQGRRMQLALEYMHSKNYVHMDVKVRRCVWSVCRAASHARESCGHMCQAAPTGQSNAENTACLQADNMFVDMSGLWWLGDFGSAVIREDPIISTSPWFAPSKHLNGEPARFYYDWQVVESGEDTTRDRTKSSLCGT
jgi:hypothetical protein